MSNTGAQAAGAVTCANHPSVETLVSCSTCGKPICPDCMVPAAVGIKCRECARLPRSARVLLTPRRAGRAVGVALAVGTGIGVLLAFAGTAGFGFLTIIIALGVGYAVGRATLRASGYHRASTTGWIAAGGAAWAYVCPAVVLAVSGTDIARVGVQIVGLALAAFFAYREAS